MTDASRGKKVVIVGGGIIGIASAHSLVRAGFEVTIVDRGRIGGGCSQSNCGLVTPSHVLPLAVPGMLGSSLHKLLKRDGPLKIRPRLNSDFIRWLWSFASRCNPRSMLESAQRIAPLIQESRQTYRELMSAGDIECEWQEKGLLFVYRSPEAFEGFAATNDLLAEQFDTPATRLDAQQLAAAEPTLKPGLAGAWQYPCDAHLRPERLISSWCDRLRRDGVTFREQATVTALTPSPNSSYRHQLSIAEDSEPLQADTVVIATGAWTPHLSELVGVKLPIQPGKGYSITMDRPASCPQSPLMFAEDHVALTPMESGLRLGSMMELVGYDDSIPPRRLELLRSTTSRYVQFELPPVNETTWYGWRPMTIDSAPIIAACPGKDQVFVAAGHNMLGLSMAPATARILTDFVTGKIAAAEVERYRIDRY